MANFAVILAFLAAVGAAEGPRTESDLIQDSGKVALDCFHPYADFSAAELMEAPWSGEAGLQAMRSTRIRVYWRGKLLGKPYFTDLAILGRTQSVRVFVLHDNAWIPPRSSCPLLEWAPVPSTAVPDRTSQVL